MNEWMKMNTKKIKQQSREANCRVLCSTSVLVLDRSIESQVQNNKQKISLVSFHSLLATGQ